MIAMSKLACLAVLEHSSSKPLIVFVPSMRQRRLTVNGIGNYHEALDEQGKRMVQRLF